MTIMNRRCHLFASRVGTPGQHGSGLEGSFPSVGDYHKYSPKGESEMSKKYDGKWWGKQLAGMKWCPNCRAWHRPEGKLNAQGIYDTCPECGEEI